VLLIFVFLKQLYRNSVTELRLAHTYTVGLASLKNPAISFLVIDFESNIVCRQRRLYTVPSEWSVVRKDDAPRLRVACAALGAGGDMCLVGATASHGRVIVN